MHPITQELLAQVAQFWHNVIMISVLKNIATLLYKSGDNLVHNDGVEMAGYLTFLAILSLFPFLVLIIATAGFFGQGEAGAQFISLLISHLPREAVSALKPRIDEIISGPPQGLLTVSIMGAIWTSSSAVEGMRQVLNRAYKVANPPTYILRRLLSIVQILLFTLLLIVIMLVMVLAPILIEPVSAFIGYDLGQNMHLLTRDFIYIGSFMIWVGITSVYYVLPNIKHSLLRVLPGALLVVVLWVSGAALLSYYLNNVHQVNIIYGSLSGFIATLIFFYVMNLIFIYGAEFNHELWVNRNS